jgi:hypothetical protein
MKAEIPGLDKSLQFDFEGAFGLIPFRLNGAVGPIWAWIESGDTIKGDLTAGVGGATVKINGEIGDPADFKDLVFTVAAEGASIGDIARLAGVSDVPELGAFTLEAKVADPQERLALEELKLQMGNDELARITLQGSVQNLLAVEGIKLSFTAQGKDMANLTKIGLPPPPRHGAFRISAKVSDPEPKIYALDHLNAILGENEINGQVILNLAEELPFLTAQLASQKSDLGPARLDLRLNGPVEKLAITKFDFNLGTPELAEIRLIGIVENLMELRGVDMNFQARGKDLANLRQLTGHPVPVRGPFRAAGKVLIPVRKDLKIPDLKITAGKNNIRGSLDLDLRGDEPRLNAVLSLPKLDLASVLSPKLAEEQWVRGLSSIRPLKLSVTLAGFAQEIDIEKVDLKVGTYNSVELRLNGAIRDLPAQRGIDLHFAVRGNDLAYLKNFSGQPLPVQGKFVASGHVTGTKSKGYKVGRLEILLGDNNLKGDIDLNLAGKQPRLGAALSAKSFNLQPLLFSKNGTLSRLKEVADLGPLKIEVKLAGSGEKLAVQKLDLQAGTEQLAEVTVSGAVKNLSTRRGISLDFSLRGQEVAKVIKLTGQDLPIKGPYGVSGRLSDQDPQNFTLSNARLVLGENQIFGRLDLDLSEDRLKLSADLSSPHFTLRPVTLPAAKSLARIKDLGPLALAATLSGFKNQWAIENLNLNLGQEALVRIGLKGTVKNLTAPQGMELEFTFKGKDLANLKNLGGPKIPFEGPFDVAGRFVDPAPKVYKLPYVNAVWGGNTCVGWLELDVSGKRPHIKADLSSEKLDLRPLYAKAKKENRGQSPKSATRKSRVFSNEPFDLESLTLLDAHMQLNFKQLLLRGLAIDEANMTVLLEKGNLTIDPFDFMIGGGKDNAKFNLRSRDKPASMDVALKIEDFQLGPMVDQLRDDRPIEGSMEMSVILKGAGGSMAALMGGLNGEMHVAVRDGKAVSRYLDLMERYLGSGILQLFNPFQSKSEYTPINCLVNSMVINDGMADIRFLLDIDQTSILGAGTVNLKSESLDLGIKPKPKKGFMGSGVSLSLKNLSQPFRLGGTLAQPSLVVDSRRAAWTFGKLAGALALGPAGIPLFFGNISLDKEGPCAAALEPFTEKAGETAKKADTKDGSQKENRSGGFLKRLFGK